MMEGVLVGLGVLSATGMAVDSAGWEQPKSRRLRIIRIRIGVQKLCFCCSEVELPNSGREEVGECKGMDGFS
jgi:hypothetical protein